MKVKKVIQRVCKVVAILIFHFVLVLQEVSTMKKVCKVPVVLNLTVQHILGVLKEQGLLMPGRFYLKIHYCIVKQYYNYYYMPYMMQIHMK